MSLDIAYDRLKMAIIIVTPTGFCLHLNSPMAKSLR